MYPSFRANLISFFSCIAVSSAVPSIAPGAEEDNLRDKEVLVAGRNLNPQLEEYRRTALYPHPANRHIFAVDCERDPQWWGRFCVFHRTGAKIDWIANMPPLYREWEGHYIVSLHWHHLHRLRLNILEVVTSTHMGNGLLWIFALEKRELRTLMHTTALGFADEPTRLDGLPQGAAKFTEPAKIEFLVPSGGRSKVVRLTGNVVILRDNNQDEVLARKSISETWFWDAKDRVFRIERPK